MDLRIEGVIDAEELRTGPYSVTYRAQDINLNHKVAVQVFRSIGQDAHARFTAATDALIALSADSRIVTIHASGLTADGHPYLTQELYETSLADRLANDGALSPDQACEALLPVAGALAAAHSQSIVHGHLRPETVLVDVGSALKVSDFGVGHLSLAVGQAMYNPFAAPELAHDPIGIVPASDVYSFGAILSYAVGRSFESGSREPFDPDDAVHKIVETCLADDPAVRPTAESLIIDLQAAVGQTVRNDDEIIVDLGWLESMLDGTDVTKTRARNSRAGSTLENVRPTRIRGRTTSLV